MSEPKRIQLRRTKGWRMPAGAMKVDRTTRYGNPFTPEKCREAGYEGTDEQIRARCVEAFRVWLTHSDWRSNWDGPESEKARKALLESLPNLKGKDLACWCPEGSSCHADVLIEVANRT